MKRFGILVISLVVVVALVVGVSAAVAAKPQDAGNKGMDVIAKSNGFPSGPHFNLNIHGKDWDTCQATCDGGSIFIPEYGDAVIQYVTNKKSKVGNLTVLDCCAGFDGPNDVAKVQLPYEPEGFYVFARIKGKPNNGQSSNASSIVLYPNLAVQACNDDPSNPDPWFGNWTSCDEALLALGLVVGNNLYEATPEAYVRFDPEVTKGKGKSKATDITSLFTYTGWVADDSLDIAEPFGELTDADVPGGNATDIVLAAGYDPSVYDSDPAWGDNSGWVDTIGEWLLFKSDLYAADPANEVFCVLYTEEWILNIADLVVTGQPVKNDGAKLLQVRFYPVATTEYTP